MGKPRGCDTHTNTHTHTFQNYNHTLSNLNPPFTGRKNHKNTNNVIKEIQESLNKGDGLNHIKDDKLYKRNKLIKRMVECSKDNMKFMMDKYRVRLVN